MKKLCLFLLLAAVSCFGQSTRFNFTTNTPAASNGVNEQNSGTAYHIITWTKSGTVTTCQVQVDSSPDNATWSPGAVITSQTCTSNGQSTITNVVVNYVRINVTVISGGGSVTVAYSGYNTNPAGGGGGTVTHTGPLTADQPVFGNGGSDIKVGTKTGNTNQLVSFTGATTASRCLHTDASGNATVTAGDCAAGTPGGADTQVQFNDAGVFGGNAGFTFNKTTVSLVLSTTSTLTAGSIQGITSAMTSDPSGATSADFRPILITNTIPLTNSQNSTGRFLGLNIGVNDFGTGNRTHATQGLSGITSTVQTFSNAANSITWLNGIRSAILNGGTGGNTVTTATAFVGQSGMSVVGGGSATTTNDSTFRAEAPSFDATHVMTHHYAFFAPKGHTGGTGNTDGWAFFIQNSGGGDRSQLGPTYLMTLALGDFAAGGSIGSAATTVDIYPSINIAQTTAGQTLTLPSPTLATAGNILEINNTGSASFTMLGATVAATQSLQAMWNGTAWSPSGGTAVGTINAASQFSLPYYSAAGSANTLSGVAGPTTPNGVPQFWVTTPSGGVATAPAPQLAGVPVNAQTGASYTFVATDRASEVTASNAGASAYTLPQAGSAGFTANFVAALTNINTGLVTVTPTTSTVNGGASQIVPNNWHSFIYSDPSGSGAYRMPVMPTISAFTNCTDSGGNHLNFTAATGAFSCGTTSSGAGTTINPTNNVIPRRSNATTFVDSALTDDGTNVTSTERIILKNGTANSPGVGFTNDNTTGFWSSGAGAMDFTAGGNNTIEAGSSRWKMATGYVMGFGSTADPTSSANDVGFSRGAAGQLNFGDGSTAGDSSAIVKFKAQRSDTNCQNPGGTCGSAMTGMVSIAAGATTVTVATTAVTANSEIFIQEDSTLGTALSVTCNTAVARSYQITARTAGTSFVITASASPITNPACLSYHIIN